MAEADETLLIDSRSDYADAVAKLVQSAVSQIDLYSVELNRDEYATASILDHIRHWIINQPRARMRIIVHRSQAAMYRGNGLVELGLKLSSYISFREPPASMTEGGDSLVVDNRAMLRRPTPDAHVAELVENNPMMATEASKDFEVLWNNCLPSQQIRNLHF